MSACFYSLLTCSMGDVPWGKVHSSQELYIFLSSSRTEDAMMSVSVFSAQLVKARQFWTIWSCWLEWRTGSWRICRHVLPVSLPLNKSMGRQTQSRSQRLSRGAASCQKSPAPVHLFPRPHPAFPPSVYAPSNQLLLANF